MTGSSAVQIADSIEDAIRNGHLNGGDTLPPVRQAAKVLGVHHNTVASAYARLRDAGLVQSSGRAGTWVNDIELPYDALAKPMAEGVVDCASGNVDVNFLPDPASAFKHLPYQPIGYEVGGIDPGFSVWLKARLRRDGIPPDHLAVMSSSLDALERALRAHAHAGDTVLVEDPSWPPILALVRALGLRIEPVAMTPDGIDLNSLEKRLKTAVAVIMTPRAHNPTGVDYTQETLQGLRDLAQHSPRTLFIFDDHWGALTGDPLPFAFQDVEHWLYIRSASKPLGPDFRLAVCAGSERIITRMARAQILGPRWVSHIIQRAVHWLWSDDRHTPRLEAARAAYHLRRETLRDCLSDLKIKTWDGTGLHVWIHVPHEADTVQALALSGWAVQPGHPFRLRSKPGIRVSIANISPIDAPRLARDIATSIRPRSRLVT
ncbi:aminotransferase class I/II-fold pyridoxal phosphate-dependent enzyme [Woodsholea maritima]|uniref:aminotransferase class I/II-fold pyridoxal phosphate-dependent enzyme n=1 Tax=Woodsholea maritima TaxID=240237 RepID=UPI0014616413|nr:aminotransferase class I/II-fold pyridoxal phosphate-dependent enzyme [Woodsholea maritima]